MNRNEVAAFFNKCAPTWDEGMIRDETAISIILDKGGVLPGAEVLDVACGTGVLIPDYLKRQVKSVTAVDLAPEMIRIAKSKFNQENVSFICGDAETLTFEDRFDCVMVYNAFPHFPDPESLIKALAGYLKLGGRLTVAHGMSREKLEAHHAAHAGNVSIDLLSEADLSGILGKYCDVDVIISDERMHMVSGAKR